MFPTSQWPPWCLGLWRMQWSVSFLATHICSLDSVHCSQCWSSTSCWSAGRPAPLLLVVHLYLCCKYYQYDLIIPLYIFLLIYLWPGFDEVHVLHAVPSCMYLYCLLQLSLKQFPFHLGTDICVIQADIF